MKKILIGIAVIVFLLGIGWFFMMPPSIDVRVYESLKDPRITTRPDELVLEVIAKGDPNTTVKKSFGLLFGTFMGLDGARAMMPVAPKARWPIEFGIPREQYIAHFALPAPAGIKTLAPAEKDELKVELTTWAYGEVAEVLHIGSYNTEEPTVERLKKFIDAQGYEISGPHEEEYIKGPGMFWSGDPSNYYTILRYNVKRRTPTAEPEPTKATPR